MTNLKELKNKNLVLRDNAKEGSCERRIYNVVLHTIDKQNEAILKDIEEMKMIKGRKTLYPKVWWIREDKLKELLGGKE
jgi:small nuclear ribonucleoprotein (snRNP)-like protein